MKKLRVSSLLLLTTGAMLACGDDKAGDEAKKPPPPPEEGGVLGVATFRYKCTSPADAQCDFDEQLGTGTGSSRYQLPPVAKGAKFALDFVLKDGSAPPELVALHPSYATSAADGITTIRPGKTTVGLRRGADIVDIIDVKIVDAPNLKVFSADPQGKYEDVKVGSGSVKFTQSFTFRFRVAPADAENNVLAGALPCKWTTSDPNIANITTPPEDNIVTVVTGAGTGTATISVELGGKKLDIPITVGS